MTAIAAPTATFIDCLVDHFSLSYRVAHRNFDGISHDESMVQPQPGGNTVQWIARHLVGTRDRFLPALGQRPVVSAPVETLRLEELIAAWSESQDRLITGLRDLTERQLESDAPFSVGGGPLSPLGPFLIRCTFHEAYHVGQLGILRRILGKEGVM